MIRHVLYILEAENCNIRGATRACQLNSLNIKRQLTALRKSWIAVAALPMKVSAAYGALSNNPDL